MCIRMVYWAQETWRCAHLILPSHLGLQYLANYTYVPLSASEACCILQWQVLRWSRSLRPCTLPWWPYPLPLQLQPILVQPLLAVWKRVWAMAGLHTPQTSASQHSLLCHHTTPHIVAPPSVVRRNFLSLTDIAEVQARHLQATSYTRK